MKELTTYFRCFPALLFKGVGGGRDGRNALLSDSTIEVQTMSGAAPPAPFLENNGSLTQLKITFSSYC